MNIALIIAGGKGERTHQGIPKQFLSIYDKPLLIYTLESFEHHPEIDEILVVCLEGWDEILRSYARVYGINKLKSIVNGGSQVQESIYQGIMALKNKYDENTVIIIHDGVRPCINEEIISDCIIKCKEFGSGVSAMPYFGQVFWKKDEISSEKYIPRDDIMCVHTPQAYHLGKLVWAYEQAEERQIGMGYSAYTNTLMVDLGETVYFSAGSSKNMKITTFEDIEVFKSFVYYKNHRA